MKLQRENPQGRRYELEALDEDVTQIRLLGTNKSIVVYAPIEDLNQRWFNWRMKNQFIQQAFDNLNNEERKFLITGLTSKEWKELFSNEEERPF